MFGRIFRNRGSDVMLRAALALVSLVVLFHPDGRVALGAALVVVPQERILEIYLNVVEWGEGIFGAEVAARHYFGKSALDFNPQEAARLAAVLPNPRRNNPAGEQRYVVNRTRTILAMMAKRGVVSLPGEEAPDASLSRPANSEVSSPHAP